MTPVFTGRMKNGVLNLDESTGEAFTVIGSDRFINYLRSLEEKDCQIVVERERMIRSENQHGLHRVWCRIIGNHVGVSPEEIHREAKRRAGMVESIDLGKGIQEVVRTQKEFSPVEMSATIKELEFMAEFLGIRLPTVEELAELRAKK